MDNVQIDCHSFEGGYHHHSNGSSSATTSTVTGRSSILRRGRGRDVSHVFGGRSGGSGGGGTFLSSGTLTPTSPRTTPTDRFRHDRRGGTDRGGSDGGGGSVYHGHFSGTRRGQAGAGKGCLEKVQSFVDFATKQSFILFEKHLKGNKNKGGGEGRVEEKVRWGEGRVEEKVRWKRG